MTRLDWLQPALLGAALAVTSPLLGRYLARIHTGQPAFGDRVFGPGRARHLAAGGPAAPVGAALDRLCRLDAGVQPGLHAGPVRHILRTQHWLPLNPTRVGNVPPALAFNTAVSFVTGTNWQAYAGETTMSHLAQMAALVVVQFTAAAVGMSVALALVRGLANRNGSLRLGTFWEDLVRTIARVLLPIAIVSALVLISQGVAQNLHGFTNATTVAGGTQRIPGGPAATQEVLKTLGTNGGGFYNANSAHPFENPNGLTNLFELFLVLVLPFAIPLMHGRMVGDRRQGRAILPGGVGSGLYAVLVYALLAVFAGGLMVGRTPEYLGKKIRGPQMTLVVLFLLVLPAVVLGFSAAAVLPARRARFSPQPRHARADRDRLRLRIGRHGNGSAPCTWASSCCSAGSATSLCSCWASSAKPSRPDHSATFVTKTQDTDRGLRVSGGPCARAAVCARQDDAPEAVRRPVARAARRW